MCVYSSFFLSLDVLGSVDGTVKLFQISGKRVLHTFVHSTPLPPAPPSRFATGSIKEGRAESEAGISPDEEEEEEGGAEEDEEVLSVESVGLSSGDFRWAASGGLDRMLKIWDIVSGSCRSVCPHGDSVVSIVWHSVLPSVVTAALDNVVRVWDARSGGWVLNLMHL